MTAFASLNKQSVDLALAEIVLKDLIGDERPAGDHRGDHHGGHRGVLRRHHGGAVRASRSRMLVNARQIAMYLCRELTDLSLPKIGQTFGGRDHTTVMHADKKIRS